MSPPAKRFPFSHKAFADPRLRPTTTLKAGSLVGDVLRCNVSSDIIITFFYPAVGRFVYITPLSREPSLRYVSSSVENVENSVSFIGSYHAVGYENSKSSIDPFSENLEIFSYW